MPRDWSRLEVEATVADYIVMLESEIRGEPYSKADHRRALQPLLDGRSEGAIEYKHQNISAVLIDLGYPYIDGYKPAFNYQQLLFDVVEDRLRTDRELAQLVATDVERPPPPPEVDDILSTRVDPPPRRDRPDRSYERSRPPPARRAVDYLAMEARNSALGLEGERYVLGYERARLVHAGRPALAERIEHTSVVEGDGAGFDVRSYETDGSDRFIEVKTTAYGIYTPLYLSRNELRVSQEKDDRYHLYRAFQFRKSPRLFTVAGALDQTLQLEATQYVGRVG